ncbi:MAG: hypothetical protein PHO08_00690 [Methylococcales bacterium]|nr:hypothetical protein [Methylococcales bacterium]MDD5633364.1 hypothetical protein [Methylococcales bacterium]
MIKPYSKDIETLMQELYGRLSEKDRRIYAGVEALKFTCGGISYIAGLFGCSEDTVSMGINELAEAEAVPKNRNRKTRGGRKLTLEKEPDIG